MADGPQTEADVIAAIGDFQDPETGRGIAQMEQLRDIKIEGNQLSLTLALTSFAAPLWQEVRTQLSNRLKEKIPGLEKIEIHLAKHHRPAEKLGQVGLTAKAVIAVGSGKGGVGKSTIAASVAIGLQRSGCKVGLMDADIYGPSIPHLLGVEQRPAIDPETKRIIPLESQGLKLMSMGLLVPPGEAIIWRGPMLHGAITQFLRDTDWGDLDYLIIDMPPGTGDISLTLSQLLPLTGAMVVCTPQDVALLDAVKAINMFGKVNIPVLGMVENMSYFVCPDCNKQHDIFGHGGAKLRAEELGIPFLGEVPINVQIRINGDEGRCGASLDDEQTAEYFQSICQRLVSGLILKRKAEPPLPSLSVL